jgi:polyisoprenoid-binding protein YceI
MTPKFLLLSLLALPGLAAARDDAWRLDTVHTQIHFRIDHQGFSRAMGLIKVTAGRIRFDPDDWSTASVDVTADPASVLMGDAAWEDKVKSWQFFNIKRWPQARYVSRSVEKTGANTGVVHGELELAGRKQPLDIAFTLNRLGNDPYTFRKTVGFSATTTLKRSDYGMDKLLSAVGDTVDLAIEVEAVRDRGDAPAEPAAAPAPADTPTESNDGTA